MDKKELPEKKPKPDRLKVFRNLPEGVRKSFTKEEIDAFLYDDIWPDTLIEKLSDYIV